MCILNLLKLHVSSQDIYNSIHRKNIISYKKNSTIFDTSSAVMYPEFELLNNEGGFGFDTSEHVLEDYLLDCSGFHERFEEQSKR